MEKCAKNWEGRHGERTRADWLLCHVVVFITNGAALTCENNNKGPLVYAPHGMIETEKELAEVSI